jgi:hypothetical protein
VARRHRLNVFSLSFLDAMTCGLGAVVLLFMVINASVQIRTDHLTEDLQAEVDRRQEEVLDGHRRLVELRNSLRETEQEHTLTQGLSRRLIETLDELQIELATYEDSTLARREHINRLKADIRSLEQEAKRLSAAAPSEEVPGARTRAHIGDGDRQYLTGLKIGGDRIFFLVDVSASMLGDDLVNIIRRRNLPRDQRVRSPKWQQAVATMDWLTTQIPRSSQFQVYLFAEDSSALIDGSDGQWLDGSDRAVLEQVMTSLRGVVPDRGTNLWSGLASIRKMQPLPDNITLLVDGLPTMGASSARTGTVSPKQRTRLFNRAIRELPSGIPVNVILFPMEGDPIAPSAFWKLAMRSNGSFMSLSEDWP